LLLVPDAVKLPDADYFEICNAALHQCQKRGDRFAILDVKIKENAAASSTENFRIGIMGEHSTLQYGAAYYPYLQTNLPLIFLDETITDAGTSETLAELKVNDVFRYGRIRKALESYPIILPPSGAVAGVYAATDNSVGVWKAPTNLSLNAVRKPVVSITNREQDALNVDLVGGKSINAIRFFSGKGSVIWGARTLAGNDNEWRYVPVRRFFIMVEVSVKRGVAGFSFEPNDANTWVKVKAMIENFLNQLWRAGALVGSKPEHAFYVHVGLGQTMTAQDVADGNMIIEIGMALIRPAEFIILRIHQKMQQS
jgi:phage tail sheath protein FI